MGRIEDFGFDKEFVDKVKFIAKLFKAQWVKVVNFDKDGNIIKDKTPT